MRNRLFPTHTLIGLAALALAAACGNSPDDGAQEADQSPAPSAGGGALVDGDFESGLTGWTAAGTTSSSSIAHGGAHAAQVGSAAANGASSLSQTFTVPAGGGALSFWFQGFCNSTVKSAWAAATLKDTTAGATATLLANTCTKTGQWVQVTSAALTAGHSLTLKLSSQGKASKTSSNYTLFDDVQINGAVTPPPPPPPPPPAADFTLAVAAAAVTSTGAATATDTLTVAPVNGFAGDVALTLSGLPAGASGTFSPAGVAFGNGAATLTLTPGSTAAGSYSLTVTGSSGALTHSASVAWTVAGSPPAQFIQTVFLILLENHNWSQISGSASAPYINGTLLQQGAHAENYNNLPGIHPSLPNYLWLEAGTNFGLLKDGVPSQYHQGTTQHLVTLLQAAGISWRAYEEGITGTTCPLAVSGLYAPKHNPFVFFDDVTDTNNASSANCIAHERPFTQLASDLSTNQVARYNFITPDLCNDGHNPSGCASTDEVKNTDDWLAANLPAILGSAAYQSGGAIFITWDESESGDHPIGMMVLSPHAKAGYASHVALSHSSTLRTMQEIFGVTPLLGGAASANDLSDLFTSFP